MTRRVLSFISVLAILSTMAFSQTGGKISGTVYDADQNAPLAFTNVVIQGTSLGAVSDENGRYVILDVPPGTYTVMCTYIGYSTLEIKNLAVTSGLTTQRDFQMAIENVVGQVVTVIATKPLINMNATNTTRVVDADLIEDMAVRGVESVVALQTGVVNDNGNIHIRGSRTQDVAYYVDGVYMNDAFDMSNTSTVSNVAMEEMQLQTGGFSAQYGNANGGVVSTTTRSGGEKMNLDFEYIQGLGAADDGPEDKLYSLGYRLFNVSAGGPIGSKIRYFVNYENRSTDDPGPSSAPHYAMDRHSLEVDWSALTFTQDTNDVFTNIKGDLIVGGTNMGTVDVDGISLLGTRIENLLGEHFGDTYDVIDAVSIASTSDDGKWLVNVYDNFQELNGARKNVGSVRNTITGNVMFDLKPFKIKVGGTSNSIDSHSYTHGFSLLNSDYNRKNETRATSFYTNLTWVLSNKSFLKAKFSMFEYSEILGDEEHWDDVESYGVPGETGSYNAYLSNSGLNPLSVAALANFNSYGQIWNDYSQQSSAYTGLSVDYLNQMGDHEVTAGFEYRGNTIKYYRVGDPLELASQLKAGQTAAEEYIVYRNAYVDNIGFDIYGEEDESGNGYLDPGTPVVAGAYFNDKIELKDLVVNLGLRYEYFNANTQAPADWNKLYLKAGQLDREKSGYADVDADVQLNPRLGLSFPVTDKTKFHAQYGKFSQHPILNRLYISDAALAANFTSGNYTNSPNASLVTEKTTQYEVGFSQVVGSNVALDVTGFYKEVRDYTTLKNLQDGTIDGAQFVWAQYQNGDYGVIKGMSIGMGMNRTGGLMANMSYTVSWAEGTGSDPESNYYAAWQSDRGEDAYPTMINPLDYDQRHTGNLLLDYRFGDIGMLSNTGINMIYTFGSGTAYTPAAIESWLYGRGEVYPTAPINSGVTPWTSNMDIRLDTGLDIGGIGMTVYLLVQNALATENVTAVYSGTGNVGTDGWLYTDPGKAWLSGNPNAEDYYLGQIRSPNRWDKPRTVQLGVKLNLFQGE